MPEEPHTAFIHEGELLAYEVPAYQTQQRCHAVVKVCWYILWMVTALSGGWTVVAVFGGLWPAP
jgi:hypothetical protein